SAPTHLEGEKAVAEQAKRLQERRTRLWEELKALADRAADETRALEGEEERQWTEGNAELDALDMRIKAIIDGETRAKEQEEGMARLRGDKKPESGGVEMSEESA